MAKVAKRAGPRVLSGGESVRPSDAAPGNAQPLPLWLWPLLGALLLAPLRAGQFERVPVATVNVLISTALLLYAWRPGTMPVTIPAIQPPSAQPPTTLRRLLSPTLWLGFF